MGQMDNFHGAGSLRNTNKDPLIWDMLNDFSSTNEDTYVTDQEDDNQTYSIDVS